MLSTKIICVMTAAVTEVASNTATANIVLPILAQMVRTSASRRSH